MTVHSADYGTSVNDITMDEIRAKYEVLDRIIKNPMYDGKALQSEAWEAFQEIRRLRLSLEEAQLRSIEARNPGIHIKEVRRHRNGREEACATPSMDGLARTWPTAIQASWLSWRRCEKSPLTCRISVTHTPA